MATASQSGSSIASKPAATSTNQAAPTPEPVVTKVYTPLSQLNNKRVPIGRCSAILKNHMQCWRAGDVQVQTSTVSVIDGKEVTSTSIVQFCYGHAHEQQEQDSKEAADKATLVADQAKVAADTKK
jgi:hypothetical protein